MSDNTLNLPDFVKFSEWLTSDDNRNRSLDELAKITTNPLWWLYLAARRPDDESLLQAIVDIADYKSMVLVAGQVYRDIIVRTKLTTIYDLNREDYRQMTIDLVSKVLTVVEEDDRQVAYRSVHGGAEDMGYTQRRMAEVVIIGPDIDYPDMDKLYDYVSAQLLSVMRKLKVRPSKGA